MNQTIVIIAEHLEGRPLPAAYELAAFARELERLVFSPIKIIVLGENAEGPAKKIAQVTGLDVIAVRNPSLATYNAELYKAILGEILPELNPAFVCAAQTTQGMDLGPGLAARLGAACITGVEKVSQKEGRLFFSRPMYGGKILAEICPSTLVTFLTVQPGVFKAGSLSEYAPGRVEVRDFEAAPERTRSLGVKRSTEESADIASAQVIVAAGRGVGKKENLELLARLAALFPRSAIAGSRPVCDMGWLEYKRQVGLTGAAIAPRLYLACGISGARQHIVGMRNSDFIVAVSTDPNAAIFDLADVCVVEDLTGFIPALIKEIEKTG
ncbi:MAG: electron transfer flavoprotein subunit alpha/FixB family protein [Thermodesulfobacteriota bacterium]|nr:electron transfer flavoprotein subunit alpha/FixB family protein [Thermodesulfobacteriota bacterium]